MKVVDHVSRIPKHLYLHFSEISTNLYQIYKFAGLEKEKEKGFLFAQRPRKKFSSRGEAPGRRLKQGSGGRLDSGAWGGRRRGGTWGKARGRREEPSGGLGWARGGLRRLLRGTGAATAAVGGGGGGPVARGGIEQVGEHR